MIDLKKLKDGLLAKGDCFMFGVSLFDLIELTERQEVELAAARARITALESAIRKQLNPAWECNSDHPALAAAVRDSAPAAAEQVDALSDEQITQIITAAVKDGRLSWAGFEKDDQGHFTIPSVAPYHFQLAHAIIAAQKPAAPVQQNEADSLTYEWLAAKAKDAGFDNVIDAISYAQQAKAVPVPHNVVRRAIDLLEAVEGSHAPVRCAKLRKAIEAYEAAPVQAAPE